MYTFRLVHLLSRIYLTLPISIADCERAFSAMQRIKSHLRNQMTNATLNDCMKTSIDAPTMQL